MTATALITIKRNEGQPWGMGLNPRHEIVDITPGGIAEAAGLKAGMLIVEINKESVLPNPGAGLHPDECRRRVETAFSYNQVTIGYRIKGKSGGSGTGTGHGDGVGTGTGTGNGTGTGSGSGTGNGNGSGSGDGSGTGSGSGTGTGKGTDGRLGVFLSHLTKQARDRCSASSRPRRMM